MCIRCGRCCGTGPNVALTIYDICRIAKYMNVNWRDLRGKYIIAVIADMIPIPILRGLGDRCAFLDQNEELPTCIIYPVRPMRCKIYPFIPLSPSKEDEIALDTHCLGVGEGEEIEPPWNLIKEYYRELKQHYSMLYDLVFNKGYEPLEALEKALDDLCG
ncbi:MAG: Fe-S oxidoreductase [Desulfurococcales archaeon ex4484_58]|nr:MAG: Fe-S oxidoreductase [Desulfurococcales archaeon ex4484_58]